MAGVLAAGVIGLAACSSSGTSSGSGSAGSAKVPLVLYSAQGYDHAMAAAFTKATGIQVKLDDNSTSPLLTQLIRPTGVALCPRGGQAAHLTGMVADVAFRGRVGLALDPAGCHLFPAPDESAAPGATLAGEPAAAAGAQSSHRDRA